VSTAWIPGNFLSSGPIAVDVAVSTHVPLVRVHALVQAIVGFEVIDNFEGAGVRGDYLGEYPGVVRPMVDWTTRYEPSLASGATPLSEEMSTS
jgi:lipopolysaccharide transport system ATP-binding protein